MEDRNGGQILLVLVTASPRTAAQLTTASGLSPASTLRELARLVEQGFVVVADTGGAIALYRLNPKGVRTQASGPRRRVLLIEDDVAVLELMELVLADEGYAVVITRTPAEANALLTAVDFDLVITDGFSKAPRAIVANTLDVLTAAGATPVALFTAHRMELAEAQAVGFRDMLTKPFDLDTLERQIRTLLETTAR